jgi:hypothetical protein
MVCDIVCKNISINIDLPGKLIIIDRDNTSFYELLNIICIYLSIIY